MSPADKGPVPSPHEHQHGERNDADDARHQPALEDGVTEMTKALRLRHSRSTVRRGCTGSCIGHGLWTRIMTPVPSEAKSRMRAIMNRRSLLPLLVTAMTLASCSRTSSIEQAPLRIAGGPKDATFYILATALASAFRARVTGIRAEGLETKGTAANIEAVETGIAECGLVSADLVYNAHARGTRRRPEPHLKLRGVAVMFPNTLHVVTRSDSSLTTLANLSAKRFAAALPGDLDLNGSDPRMDAIAAAIADVAPSHVGPETMKIGMDEAVVQLEAGGIEAAQFAGGFPFRPVSESARRFGIHLLDFDERATSVVKAKYPFLRPVIVPAGTYQGQTQAVRSVAVDNVLICSADLAADLVYQLTRALYEGLPEIARAHASASQINPEHGASTPIPLHDGASRYYRERELFR